MIDHHNKSFEKEDVCLHFFYANFKVDKIVPQINLNLIEKEKRRFYHSLVRELDLGINSKFNQIFKTKLAIHELLLPANVHFCVPDQHLTINFDHHSD